jgi:hypothetical protein
LFALSIGEEMSEVGVINEITMMTVGIGARKLKYGSSSMLANLKVGDSVEYDANDKGWVSMITKTAVSEPPAEKPDFVPANTLPPNPPKPEAATKPPAKVATPPKEPVKPVDPPKIGNILPVREDGTNNPDYQDGGFSGVSQADIDVRKKFVEETKTKYPDMTPDEMTVALAAKFKQPEVPTERLSQKLTFPESLTKDFKTCKYCNAPVVWAQERQEDGKTVKNVPYSIIIRDGVPARDGVHDCRKKDGQHMSGGTGSSKDESISWQACYNTAQRIVDPLFQMGDDKVDMYDNVIRKTELVISAAKMLKNNMAREMSD